MDIKKILYALSTVSVALQLWLALIIAALISYFIPAITIQWAYFLILSIFVLLED